MLLKNQKISAVPADFATKVPGARYSTTTSKSQNDANLKIQYGLLSEYGLN